MSGQVSSLANAPFKLRVYSYNVLSSSLASPGYFRACDPNNLDAGVRLAKIKSKLLTETRAKSIICLQELSQKWQGPLEVFFEQNNYQLITGLYGRSFNGYMGIALAYPLDVFSAESVEVQTLADVGTWPTPPQTDSESKKLTSTLTFPMHTHFLLVS